MCRISKLYKHILLLLKIRLIQPDGPLYGNWCLALTLPMAHTALLTPCVPMQQQRFLPSRGFASELHSTATCRYYVGMMKEPVSTVHVIDRLVDCFFLVDIAVNFMLSYRSSKSGGMIDHPFLQR
jgi:hypothetical protein